MIDYFLYLVLPALLPPIVGCWKGPGWGAAVVAVSLAIPLSGVLGFAGVPWFAATLIGALLVLFQWIAVRFGQGPVTEEQGKQ